MTPIIALPELMPICRGCPSDWEARDHLGREVYIRYRWGRLTVEVSTDGLPPKPLLTLNHGDPMDGLMSTDEMVELTKGVIEWRKHRIHYPA